MAVDVLPVFTVWVLVVVRAEMVLVWTRVKSGPRVTVGRVVLTVSKLRLLKVPVSVRVKVAVGTKLVVVVVVNEKKT